MLAPTGTSRYASPLTRHRVLLGLVPALLLLSGWLLDRPQARTPAITVFVGGSAVQVEVADSPAARARGLSGRKSLAADAGMLFVYPEPAILTFWMKETPMDLDIGFFDGQARLLEIHSMVALDEHTRHVSGAPAKYALEVNRGWFATHRISRDAVLQLPSVGDARHACCPVALIPGAPSP